MRLKPFDPTLWANAPQNTPLRELRRAVADSSDKVFIDFEGEKYSYAEVDQISTRMANSLASLGLKPGETLTTILDSGIDAVACWFGANKIGAIWVPVNTAYRHEFLRHQVADSGARIVVCESHYLASVLEVAGGLPDLELVLVTGSAPLPRDAAVRVDHLGKHRGADDTLPDHDPRPADIACLIYTSGTTGPSKGVLMPQAHCFLFAKGAAEAVALREGEDRYFVCMPFFHANALFMQVYACLVAGAPATVVKRFSVTSWLDQVITCGATATNALGVMPEFIFRQPPDPRDRSHRVTRVMAVPIAEEWGAAFEERFGVRLVQGFGMTEVNMVAYSDPADPVLAGCAGRVLHEYFEVVVADPETDEPLPAGEAGEILVRPKVPSCFNQGYFRMPDKTVEAYRNLWFHTGDAGRFDAEGRLYFIDRLKDRIRRRGENISSYEIEQVLNEHPAVLESAAVGVRVEGAGGEEEIKAVLVLHPGADAGFDPLGLLDYCVERMPRYAVPRFIEVVPDLDKTPSGKVRKQSMRDGGITPSTWDRESVGYTIKR